MWWEWVEGNGVSSKVDTDFYAVSVVVHAVPCIVGGSFDVNGVDGSEVV